MKAFSTKCSRGTSSMARSTAGSLMPRRRKPSRNCMRPTLSSPGGCLGTPSLPPDLTPKPRFGQSASQRQCRSRRHDAEPTRPQRVRHPGHDALNRICASRSWAASACRPSSIGLYEECLNFALTACWRGSGGRPRLPLTEPLFPRQRNPSNRRVAFSGDMPRAQRPTRRLRSGRDPYFRPAYPLEGTE